MEYDELCTKIHKHCLKAIDNLDIGCIMTALDDVKNHLLIEFVSVNSEVTYDEKQKEGHFLEKKRQASENLHEQSGMGS